MSFFLDPILLAEAGGTIGSFIEDDRLATAAEVATVVGFYAISVPLYFDAEWTRPIWRLCGAESGRDWMLNSGLFKFDHRDATWKTHLISGAIFLTYPVWLVLGFKLGRRRFKLLAKQGADAEAV